MKTLKSIRLVTLSCLLGCQITGHASERESLNDGWKFLKGDAENVGDELSYPKLKPWLLPTANAFLAGEKHQRPAGDPPGEKLPCAGPDFDDSSWRSLNLPHDWGIEGPFQQELPGETAKLPWFGVAWYRKTFELPASDAGKIIRLQVDGAMSYAAVWCNGRFVGGWPYGYASWQLDLTPYLKPGGPNSLAIRIDNPDDSSRWYPGGGIYRNVWILKSSPVHVGQWGTVVTTPSVSDARATLAFRSDISNASEKAVRVRCVHQVFAAGPDGSPSGPALVNSPVTELSLAPRATVTDSGELSLSKPARWSPVSPRMYVMVTRVQQDGKEVDRHETPFGIRTMEFSSKDGFLLNGEKFRIHGVCMHHDLGALGSAFHFRAAERQLEILKEMGCNAVRMAHNPPAPEYLDLCDRMGFLVIDEFTDTWTVPKKPNGYARLFPDWSEADLRAIIRRDRNHPSILLWSTGNEVGEQGKGHPVSQRLTDIVHEEDPTRPSTVGCDRPYAGTNGFQKTVGVFGYNYKPHEYENFHKANPKQPLYGSETASTLSSRGEYLFPVDSNKEWGKIGFQMSSYDLYAPGWAQPAEWEFAAQDKYPFVAGEFVWTGFDYLGEPTPFNSDLTVLTNFHTPEERAKAEAELAEIGKLQVPSRSSYFGILDLAGFKKDRFFLYQARWRPDHPMAHILPHWNWPERKGEVTPVHVYTSGDEAELFLNGASLGRRKPKDGETRIRWDDVTYAPGELKVIAYRDGKKWAEDAVVTTGEPAKLLLTADRDRIRRDGKDLSYVTLTVADANGRLVPRSKVPVRFEIAGPGEIVATDNGDPTDHTIFASPARKSFNGLALAIIRLRPDADGPVTVKAVSDGLQPATIEIQAR